MTNKQQARVWRRIGKAFERRGVTGQWGPQATCSTEWGLCRAVYDLAGTGTPESTAMIVEMGLHATTEGEAPNLGRNFLWVPMGDYGNTEYARQAARERALFAYLLAEYLENP
jgi:hypothetical protein